MFIVLEVKYKALPPLSVLQDVVSANIFISSIMRQEDAINLLYEFFTYVPLRIPLGIRRNLANIYHYGGLHSGCGVSATAWYIYYTGTATHMVYMNGWSDIKTMELVTSYVVLLLLILILIGCRYRYYPSECITVG